MSAPVDRFSREAEFVLWAARSAGRLCRRVQERRVQAAQLVKGDKSPVTIADFASQAIVAHRLALAFPDDALMGEEDAQELRAPSGATIAAQVCAEVRELEPAASLDDVLTWIDRARSDGGRGRFWCLDPIDGTKGFLRGEQYAVALALLDDGEVKVGALACPNLAHSGGRGCVVVAIRGGGAQLYPLDDGGSTVTARASARTGMKEARLLESVESSHGDHGSHERIKSLLGIVAPSVRLDSQAKYAVLARGDAEIYLRMPTSADYRENLWDHAAGALVIEEAGGRVTDVDGKALDFTTGRKLAKNRGIVATNGRLHDAVVAAIRNVASRPP